VNEADVLKRLEKVGALITNSHLVYTSGRHGSAYVNKDAVYPHTALTSELCREFATRFRDERVEVCLAPAIGGVILSQWTAHHLSSITGREVLGVYAEKTPDGGFVIKRGYDKLTKGKRVLVLEDILTTGISVKRTVETVRAIGGDVIGVAALCNRGGVSAADLGAPRLEALVKIELESWEAAECPLCRKGVPVNTELGKGKGV
jgi:orotate phosphoribosyltransferase